jgi:hypothetical protein
MPAQYSHIFERPLVMTNDIIVLIPGIGGSRLERDGKAIYDLSLSALPSLIWNWVGGDNRPVQQPAHPRVFWG